MPRIERGCGHHFFGDHPKTSENCHSCVVAPMGASGKSRISLAFAVDSNRNSIF
jgi:hypothetical protein